MAQRYSKDEGEVPYVDAKSKIPSNLACVLRADHDF